MSAPPRRGRGAQLLARLKEQERLRREQERGQEPGRQEQEPRVPGLPQAAPTNEERPFENPPTTSTPSRGLGRADMIRRLRAMRNPGQRPSSPPAAPASQGASAQTQVQTQVVAPPTSQDYQTQASLPPSLVNETVAGSPNLSPVNVTSSLSPLSGASSSPATKSSSGYNSDEAARPSSAEFVRHSISNLSLSDGGTSRPPPVVRKGTSGTRIPLEVNLLKLEVEKNRGYFEYEVLFHPILDAKKAKFACLWQMQHVIGVTKIFDGGSKLCLPIKLEREVHMEEVSLPPEFPSVRVTLKFKRQHTMGSRDAVHMYNVLFHKIMMKLQMVQMNRHHYNPAEAKRLDSLRLEIWPGLVTAVNEMEGGLFLTCDVSHRVLRAETAHAVIKDAMLHSQRQGCSMEEGKRDSKRALIGETMLTRYNNNTYRVDDINFDGCPEDTFINSRGVKISFVDYYKQQYGLEIMDTRQPLLLSLPKKRQAGDANKQICLIPELCHMTGLTDRMRSDHKMMKSIHEVTRSNPTQRSRAIQKFVSAVKDNPEASCILSDWGLTLASACLRTEGRVQEKVKLLFGPNQISEPVDADFSRNLGKHKMMKAPRLQNWILLCERKNRRVAESFLGLFCRNTKLGMEIAQPQVIYLNTDRTEEYLKAIRQCSQGVRLDLVFAIFSTQRSDRYAALKKLCYVELGIACQVMQCRTLAQERKAPAIVEKIGMQINAKLGGELWGCANPFSNAMVIGIDVYHGGKDSNTPSWAGFVASMNKPFTRWYSETVEQRPGTEMVDCMKVMFINALKKYYDLNNKYPDKIIVYRDGVGDGRLEFTREYELAQLQSAFSVCGQEYSPPITFVIVSKRINTRLLYVNPRSNELENPPPGTVLDHTVTKRDWFDFFLVSQKVNQGTVSPTHYTVIHDGIDMGPDKIQKLSYRLTYMYYNWPGSVRVPAPCLYAHKIAGMAGDHLKKRPHPLQADKLFYL